MKLRYFQLYFIKNNISTLTDFRIYIFSTVLFATLIEHGKNRGTGLVPAKSTGTGISVGPNSELTVYCMIISLFDLIFNSSFK